MVRPYTLPLFEGLPPYQMHSETSRQAALAALPNAETLRRLVLEFFQSRGLFGATTDEMSLALGMHLNSVAPRRVELERAGFLRKAGFRRKTRGGRSAEVYQAAGL